MFIWPTEVRRITSHYNKNRKHPVTGKVSYHAGMDIAQAGAHEIFAAASGVVTRSYTSKGYGECVMIMHSLRGNTYETVYAHLKEGSRKVKVNDKVTQGQPIGIMGNTGNSTGQHLHFELHVGRWNSAQSNAVDPLKYLKEKSTNKQQSDVNTYVVKAGETLSGIAKKKKTSVKMLVEINGIKNKDLIYPGQVLQLPIKTTYYIVKKGDTLSQIAGKYKTTAENLAAANNIKNINLIHPGQKLKV